MVTFRCYWRPKSDHDLHEWEDGAAYSEAREVAAIADGASSSFDAQRWAAELTRAFVADPPRTVDAEAFEQWAEVVAAGFEGREHTDDRDRPDVTSPDRTGADGRVGDGGSDHPDPTYGDPPPVQFGRPVADPDAAGVPLRHGQPVVDPVLAVGRWGPGPVAPRVGSSIPVSLDDPTAPATDAPQGDVTESAADAERGRAVTQTEGEGDVRASATEVGDDAAATATPWYVQEAAARGSFATFLGLQFTETPDERRWRALAVGDACCFQVRGTELIEVFPLSDPDEFDSSPALLSSQVFRGSHGGHHLQVRTGSVQTGDVFYLATDAVAEWLLGRVRFEPDVWEGLADLDHEGFAALVEDARRAGEMGDDDSTLLRAVVGATDA